jgi:TRAP-type mannitol/chloroaromatic compound transport system permease small subunit
VGNQNEGLMKYWALVGLIFRAHHLVQLSGVAEQTKSVVAVFDPRSPSFRPPSSTAFSVFVYGGSLLSNPFP